MQPRQRPRLLVAAVIAAVAMTGSPSATIALNYAGNCFEGTDGFYLVWQGKDHNDIPNDPYINGAYSEAWVRWLNGCYYSGDSFVLPANISGSTAPRVVQLGYGRNQNGGYLRFWWTPADNTGGSAVEATAWAGVPQENHKYWFVIDESVTGKWRYCVKDMTAGTAQVCNSSVSRTWNDGYLAWWAYEVYNTMSVMGTSGSDATASMSSIRYHYSSFSNPWTIRTGMPACARTGSPPSKYSCHVFTVTYASDAFYVHTH